MTGDGGPGADFSSLQIFVSMGLVPLFTAILRSFPPLSQLQEGRR